jgi:hypothetical protein
VHFSPQIMWTMNEVRVLREAFAPIHVIEDLWPQLGGADEIQKLVHRVSDQRGPFTEQQLEPGRVVLKFLAERLLVEAHAVPDPQWVAQTKAAASQGGVGIVTDPEKAMLVMNEVRKRQYEKATDGLRLFDLARAFLREVQANVRDAPGDKYEERGPRRTVSVKEIGDMPAEEAKALLKELLQPDQPRQVDEDDDPAAPPLTRPIEVGKMSTEAAKRYFKNLDIVRTVETSAELNEIPKSEREPGMRVFVNESKNVYVLANDRRNWRPA